MDGGWWMRGCVGGGCVDGGCVDGLVASARPLQGGDAIVLMLQVKTLKLNGALCHGHCLMGSR